MCDVVYVLLLGRVERQTLALQQQFAVYQAAGAELDEPWPSLDEAQARLDEALDAEPELTEFSPLDRELFALMGVGR